MAAAWTAGRGGIDCACADRPATRSIPGRHRSTLAAVPRASSTRTVTTMEATMTEVLGDDELVVEILRRERRLVADELLLSYPQQLM